MRLQRIDSIHPQAAEGSSVWAVTFIIFGVFGPLTRLPPPMHTYDTFLRVLMFDISADWPEIAKFSTRKHYYMHYTHIGTLDSVDPVPFPRTNRKI